MAQRLAKQLGAFLRKQRGDLTYEQFSRKLGICSLPGSQLSTREWEVLRYTACGLRSKEIAARLKLSKNTVESYRCQLKKKLRFASIAELVRYAVREGIIEVGYGGHRSTS